MVKDKTQVWKGNGFEEFHNLLEQDSKFKENTKTEVQYRAPLSLSTLIYHLREQGPLLPILLPHCRDPLYVSPGPLQLPQCCAFWSRGSQPEVQPRLILRMDARATPRRSTSLGLESLDVGMEIPCTSASRLWPWEPSEHNLSIELLLSRALSLSSFLK